MTDDALDTWLSSWLNSLHDALDDVLDLERGLTDVTLPRAHAQLVDDLSQVLNLDAGLAQLVPPPPEQHSGPPERLASAARELATLPPAERLATRVWLPLKDLAHVHHLTGCLPRARALASFLDDPGTFAATRGIALAEARRLAQDVGTADHASLGLHPVAEALAGLLECDPPITHEIVNARANAVAIMFGTVLRTLLDTISRDTHGEGLADQVTGGFTDAAELHLLVDGDDIAGFEAALRGPVGLILSAVTDMVGADLELAELNGVPLDGVLWSADTRWPQDMWDWVRDNSVRVSADVFKIRERSTGATTYALT